MGKLKKFIGYTFAGMIGAAFVLGVNFMFSDANAGKTAYNASFPSMKVSDIYEVQPQKTTTASFPQSFNSAAKKATPAVVKIKTKQGDQTASRSDNPLRFFFGEEDIFGPREGAGSGVIISSDGYIVTNNHVIENADEFDVTLDDLRTFSATKIGVDKRTDLAVLKIEAQDLHFIEYADSDKVLIGDWVLAIGNPFEYLTSTVTAGIVSAKGRDINILNDAYENIESFIQTDAAVNPGNSGGALVNAEGDLVGINTAIATQTGTFSGYSFAIPVNLMKKIVDDIITYGGYQRAMLGVGIEPIGRDIAEDVGVEMNSGVFVNRVTAGGAAELAGVLPKDIIATVNGQKVNSVPQIQALIGGKKVGEVVDLEIIRKGQRREVAVRLKEG